MKTTVFLLFVTFPNGPQFDITQVKCGLFSDCAIQDLQNTTVVYPGWRISGENHETHSNINNVQTFTFPVEVLSVADLPMISSVSPIIVEENGCVVIKIT